MNARCLDLYTECLLVEAWADSEGSRLRGLCAMVIKHARRSPVGRQLVSCSRVGKHISQFERGASPNVSYKDTRNASPERCDSHTAVHGDLDATLTDVEHTVRHYYVYIHIDFLQYHVRMIIIRIWRHLGMATLLEMKPRLRHRDFFHSVKTSEQ